MVRFLPKWASKLVGRRQPNHDLSAASVEVEDNPSDRLLEVTSGAETPLPATQVIEVRDIEVEDNPSDRLLEATSGAETPLPATQVIEVRDIEESREVSSCGHWYVLKIGSYANLFLMIAFVFWGPTPVYIAESYLPPVPNIVAFRIHDWLSKPGCTAVYSRDCLARRWNYYMSLLICLVGSSVLLAQVVVCAVFGARGFFRQATGHRAVHNGVDDTWAVTPIVATVSSITFFTFCAWLTVQESVRGRLSTGNGLSWEAWVAFILYNSLDVLLQALARGMSAPSTLELKKLFIMDRVALLNMPILGSRMDTFKDMVFIALCVQGGLPILTLLASITLLGTQMRTWAKRNLRYEVRHDHVPILRPTLPDMPLDETQSLPRTGVFGFVLHQAKSASLPIKQETAFLEDLPQAILQAVWLHFIGGSSFVVFSLAVACVKGCGVIFLAFALARFGNASDHITNLVSSPIMTLRSSAFEELRKLGDNPGNEVIYAFLDALEDLQVETTYKAEGFISGGDTLERKVFQAVVSVTDWQSLHPDVKSKAFEALVGAVGDYDKTVRVAAVENLAKLEDVKACEVFIGAVTKDKDDDVLRAAIGGLRRLGNKEAREALVDVLQQHSEDGARLKAAAGLVKVGGPQALDALIGTLSDENAPRPVKTLVAHALCLLGSPKARVRVYCGRHVGAEGYADGEHRNCKSNCLCDGRCGPTNGCQCKACYSESYLEGDFGLAQLTWKGCDPTLKEKAITALKAAKNDKELIVRRAANEALTKLGA